MTTTTAPTLTIVLTVFAGWMRDEVTNTTVQTVADPDGAMAAAIARFAPAWPA